MTAFQDSFQAEVARLVRKQVKDDQAALKKSDRAQRSEVANLKQDDKVPVDRAFLDFLSARLALPLSVTTALTRRYGR